MMKRFWLGGAAMAVAAVMLQGCSSDGVQIASNAAVTQTQMLVTDAAADQVLALKLTVDSIVLTDASGASTTVLSTPTDVEASHLNAVREPLGPPVKVAQDTYVSATIKVANPVVVYLDPSTKKVVTANATLAAATTTVTFPTPITVTATSKPLVFDVLVGQSVAISGTTVTVTPTFNVFQISLASKPTNGSNGRLDDVVGQVTSVSGTSLVITTPSGQTETIATDTDTRFSGVASLSAVTTGELVDVDVDQESNGTLLADRITVLAANGQALLLGPVTGVTGSPATSYTQVIRQPLGLGSSATGATYTVAVTSATTFGLSPKVTLPVLPFTPMFSAATLVAGQNVATVAGTVNTTAGTATAASVTLAPQTVEGTVSAVSSVATGLNAYTVTLPTGSALATATGATTVVVYANTSTQMMNASTIATGSTVRFNGLLFKDGGTLRLVAGACSDAAGAAPPQKH